MAEPLLSVGHRGQRATAVMTGQVASPVGSTGPTRALARGAARTIEVATPQTGPMDSYEGPLIAAALEHQVRSGATATQIAASVATTWRHAEQCLTPVIGPQGVAALYKRSLLLTGRSYSWLSGLHEGVPPSVDLTTLTSALAVRESAEAAQAGGELLQTVYGLVAGLIGPSLTHRLLRAMWQTS